ncbi:MAG: ABC transporter permease [Alphaproteobacteria bacterium GM202ARS2]|nr:ABC transporter permease [Alphaproteobacteria bacterium GM202ARS2]
MRNRRSFYTLCTKEVFRFLNVPLQTVWAPLMTSVLFLSVFTLALRRADLTIETIPFAAFLACGLLSMSIMQNAFANSSSSIMHSKVLGGLSDVLMAPLSPYEIATAWIFGGVARGLFVGIINSVVLVPVIAFYYDLTVNVWVLAYYAVMASIMMANFGLIAGLYAQKFDQMASISTFVIMPATFLSGTFYSVRDLPASFRLFVDANPLHYAIDGIRYGLIGYHDSNLVIGASVIGISALSATVLAFILVVRGWRIIP